MLHNLRRACIILKYQRISCRILCTPLLPVTWILATMQRLHTASEVSKPVLNASIWHYYITRIVHYGTVIYKPEFIHQVAEKFTGHVSAGSFKHFGDKLDILGFTKTATQYYVNPTFVYDNILVKINNKSMKIK